MTIEYEKKEKRGRRGLRDVERLTSFERDFDGHVLMRIHLIIERSDAFDNWCEVLVDSE